MQQFLEAIQSGASGDDIANLPIPESYRAAFVKREETAMFEGVDSWDKDPRKSLHVEEVATPELAPDEVYIAVMASSINFNTVWTSIFEPLPTFGFLDRMGRQNEWGKRHSLPYHVVGSDASAVVVRVGSAVRLWKPGDRVTVHCNYVDDQDPSAHNDSMLATNQLIWGFETNFGALADLAVVKANQLMPKPSHLSWEESAVNGLCSSTSYRMLVSENGAQMKQGDSVLIWGATGGIGGYAVQYVLNGGGTPIGVVSSPSGRSCSTRWAVRPSSTAVPRTISSGPTSTPRTNPNGAASARRSASSTTVRTSTRSSSTRAARRWVHRSSPSSAAARWSPALPRRATWSSSTTGTSG